MMRALEGAVWIGRIFVTLLLLLHGKRFAKGDILSVCRYIALEV